MAIKSEGDGGLGANWPVDPATGQPMTPEQVAATGLNLTGADPNQVLWRGGSRGSDSWSAPAFLQSYGNYTGMFPSLGQQVGQSLYGSIQGQSYQPAWMQTQLPARQNVSFDMSKYSPFQSGTRQVTNPYPLNGRVNLTTPNIGTVQNWSNPFIGAYSGLTGFPGNGPGAGPGTGQTPLPTPGGTPGTIGTPGTPIPTPTPTPNPNPNPSPVPTNPVTTPLPYPTVPVTQPGGTVIGTQPGGIPYTPTPTPTNPYPTTAPNLTGTPYNPGGTTTQPITNPLPAPNPVLSQAYKFIQSNPQLLRGLLGF